MDVGSVVSGIGSFFTGANPITAVAGGLFGIFGSIVNTWMDYKKMQAQNQFTLDVKRLDMEAQDKEYAANVRMKELGIDLAETQGIADAYKSAISSEGQSLLKNLGVKVGQLGKVGTFFVLVIMLPIEAVKTFLRPGLTIWVMYYVTKLLMNMPIEDPNRAMLINVYMYSFVMILSFWFMDRSKVKDAVANKLFR